MTTSEAIPGRPRGTNLGTNPSSAPEPGTTAANVWALLVPDRCSDWGDAQELPGRWHRHTFLSCPWTIVTNDDILNFCKYSNMQPFFTADSHPEFVRLSPNPLHQNLLCSVYAKTALFVPPSGTWRGSILFKAFLTLHPPNIEMKTTSSSHWRGPVELSLNEIKWRDRQRFLESKGYMLRPRLRPGWTPSWVSTGQDYYACEDSAVLPVS